MSERPEKALKWIKYYAPTQAYEDISNYITQLEAERAEARKYKLIASVVAREIERRLGWLQEFVEEFKLEEEPHE